MNYWKIPRLWEGATCYILGGGPSLADVPFTSLHSKHVIAINDAYKLHQWDCMYFKDEGWYNRRAHKFGEDNRTNGECLKSFAGLKVTNCLSLIDEVGLKVCNRGQRTGIELKPDSLNQGSNAGQEALILAIKLGVAKVILLGYDMQVVGERHNWHADHTRVIPNHVYEAQFIPRFAELNAAAEQMGVKVVNCTPESALQEFTMGVLSEHL